MNSTLVHQTDRRFNVCLHGASLDTGNQGCSALAVSLIKLMTDSKPNCGISLLFSGRRNGVQYLRVSGLMVEVDIVNCRLSPMSRLNENLFWILFLACLQRTIRFERIRDRIVRSNPWLNSLKDADFVGNINGGDSFSDIYGTYQFLRSVSSSVIAILMRKKLVLLPQTYGPYKSVFARWVARYVIRRAARIYSRDKNSIKVVHNLLGEKGKHKAVEFCPDVAFVLESIMPEDPNICPKLDKDKQVTLIGLNISNLLYVDSIAHKSTFGIQFDYREFILSLIKRLMERTDAHILLVPHVTAPGGEAGEVALSREVAKSIDGKYSNRLYLVAQQYDQSEIKGLIGLCDFFIGSRMHTCIAALSEGIPAIGLAYSDKFKGVFQSVGVDHCVIDIREKKQEETIDAIVEAFEKRNSIVEILKKTIPEVKKKVVDVFEKMLRAEKV
jgi:polysaccharide pyruvyl transferase WcaK-like protein